MPRESRAYGLIVGLTSDGCGSRSRTRRSVAFELLVVRYGGVDVLDPVALAAVAGTGGTR